MKTQQELMQAYWGPGGTVDMVKEYNAKHGCDVKPYECVKDTITGEVYCYDPVFVSSPDKYTFALTILYDDKRKEHRPVFVGDKVYHKEYGIEREIVSGNLVSDFAEKFSWNPPTPKRTFKIGDMELPCPVKDGDFVLSIYGHGRGKFYFKTEENWRDVGDALHNLLTSARDKE